MTPLVWEILHPGMTPEDLGLIPGMLSLDDPRPAKDQFNEHYAHGGGWRPFRQFKMRQPGNVLIYPEDPPMRPLAQCQFRNELILYYESSWVAIVHKDGYYEVSRMD